MNQTQLAGTISNDVFGETDGRTDGAKVANEIRTLGDLELAMAAGGDGAIIWTPPHP
jgi:hypothetical protein